MKKFEWHKIDRKNNNSPILRDAEIDDLAEILLYDYKPNLLKEPTKFNSLHFLESYMEATVEVHNIYYDSGQQPILGATAFNHEVLKVFDNETMSAKKINVQSRTVILDSSIMEKGKEGLAHFTALHEGGHLWLHSNVYEQNEDQISLFEFPSMRPVICCRKDNIENFGVKNRVRTSEEWREHHADYFASAIAMPKSTFVPFVRKTLEEAGIHGRIIIGVDPDNDWYAEHELPSIISELYGVSKRAAYIKLKKFRFVIPSDEHAAEQAQCSLLN